MEGTKILTRRTHLKVHAKDNVAIASERIAEGEALSVDNDELVTPEEINKGRKIAVRRISECENALQYGHAISSSVHRSRCLRA